MIYSVASFFLSRIDVLVDKKLDRIAEENPGKAEQAKRLRGEVAIASAKIAYQIFLDVFESERYRNLARKGAHKQFLLWGSTSTKDPAYSDVKYVDSLIGPDTVNTLPEETFEAFLDHGSPEARLTQDIAEARDTLKELAEIGIDLDAVTEQLVREGVDKFAEPFDEMLHTLQQQMQEA